MTQIIKINRAKGEQMASSGTWQPKTDGAELTGFLNEIGRSTEVQERIRLEAEGVLGGCIQPSKRGSNVGLVLGRVQSGKTSSFTAVSALAHDNGYKFVIVIAGTTQLLVDQTTTRLKKDLRLDGTEAFRRWTLCAVSDKTKATATAAKQNLRQRLLAIGADKSPLFAGVPVVVVMKNTVHLGGLNQLLNGLKTIDGVDFERLPTLIVDDEAHMHTPNVGERKDNQPPSAVYESIRALANLFPRRSLLQYTATPQANLLMEIADELSPSFVRILEPGPGYVGGKEIFTSLPNEMVRDTGAISATPAITDVCPLSLQQATANFLLVAALDYIDQGQASHRSMLIHSDATVRVHDVYEHWVKTLRDAWRLMLDDPKTRVPRLFLSELENLHRTRPELGDKKFAIERVRPILVKVLDSLRIQSVNHKADVGKVDFNLAPYWIVNGGNILGVGYTVTGLVTTHMVRRPGVGMADTIQQRGRFFGYLDDRLKSVRIFISQTMAKRFQDYSAHEEGLRNSLKKLDATQPEYDNVNHPTLKDWKRMFWLDPTMKPTRRQAQRLMLERVNPDRDGWVTQRWSSPSTKDDSVNLQVIKAFVQKAHEDPTIGWRLSQKWGGTVGKPSTTHVDARVPLSKILEIISGLTYRADDRNRFDATRLAIEETHQDLTNATGLVVLIAQGSADKSFRRERTEPISLLQGGNTVKGGYVGDRGVFDPGSVTLQIHLLTTVEDMKSRKPVRLNMTAIGVHLPNETAEWMQNILVQQ
jgi:hypothetical protein